MVRAAAVLVVLTVLAWYFGVSEDLPTLGVWGDVAFLSFGLIPLTFSLVAIALPLRRSSLERIGWAALALVAISVLLESVDLDIAANFVKIAAVVCVAWWFLSFFEALVTPDLDASLDEAPAKKDFWEAFKAIGPWWSEQPPY